MEILNWLFGAPNPVLPVTDPNSRRRPSAPPSSSDLPRVTSFSKPLYRFHSFGHGTTVNPEHYHLYPQAPIVAGGSPTASSEQQVLPVNGAPGTSTQLDGDQVAEGVHTASSERHILPPNVSRPPAGYQIGASSRSFTRAYVGDAPSLFDEAPTLIRYLPQTTLPRLEKPIGAKCNPFYAIFSRVPDATLGLLLSAVIFASNLAINGFTLPIFPVRLPFSIGIFIAVVSFTMWFYYTVAGWRVRLITAMQDKFYGSIISYGAGVIGLILTSGFCWMHHPTHRSVIFTCFTATLILLKRFMLRLPGDGLFVWALAFTIFNDTCQAYDGDQKPKAPPIARAFPWEVLGSMSIVFVLSAWFDARAREAEEKESEERKRAAAKRNN